MDKYPFFNIAHLMKGSTPKGLILCFQLNQTMKREKKGLLSPSISGSVRPGSKRSAKIGTFGQIGIIPNPSLNLILLYHHFPRNQNKIFKI